MTIRTVTVELYGIFFFFEFVRKSYLFIYFVSNGAQEFTVMKAVKLDGQNINGQLHLKIRQMYSATSG